MGLKTRTLSNTKKRKNSSRQWLLRHFNDPYVQQAKMEGYRSRAAYKLLEIQSKFNLIKAGATVVDLGAAPGGWSQVACKIIGKQQGSVIALDLLEIAPLPSVTILQGDFCDPSIVEQLKMQLPNKVQAVICDIAPNTTGTPQIDHLRIIEICSKAHDFAVNILQEGGNFVCKAFQGGMSSELLNKIKRDFTKVKHFKPQSSRSSSSELYLVALGFKPSNS